MLPKIFVLSSTSTYILKENLGDLILEHTNMLVDETIASAVNLEVCRSVEYMQEPCLHRKVAILGNHGAGKDTVARKISEITGLRFKYSLSHTYLRTIYNALARHLPLIERFEDFVMYRHQYSGYINRAYTAIRDVSPFALLCKAVEDNDLLVGVRSSIELSTLQEADVPLIYVFRDVPDDPTVEYAVPRYVIPIDNNGSLSDLDREIARAINELEC